MEEPFTQAVRHALILASGSGLGLRRMNREMRPRQLVPLRNGRSPLAAAAGRREDVATPAKRYVCAGEKHRAAVCAQLPNLQEENFVGKPAGRDTLNAIGLSGAPIARREPEAGMVVFPAGHLIEPAGDFQDVVGRAFAPAEEQPEAPIAFGVPPRNPSTYGYPELGAPFAASEARLVQRDSHREDPDAAGQAQAWTWSAAQRPGMPGLATPFRSAVMETASEDPEAAVAAMPLLAHRLDIGSWPSFGRTSDRDAEENAATAECCVLQDGSRTLALSEDPAHRLAIVGCEDPMVVHTPDATPVCRAGHAERIQRLQRTVEGLFGQRYSRRHRGEQYRGTLPV